MKSFALLLLLGSIPAAWASPGTDEALERLKAGNERFSQGSVTEPHRDAAWRKDVAVTQHPFAVLLSCSDSRVAPEFVFDQGIGDLFVVRVAGNVARADETASVEYGVEHLGAPLVVVLGHSACGAVTAAVQGAHGSADLEELLKPIGPAVDRARQSHPGVTGSPLIAAAIEANVWLSIENLYHRSSTLRQLARDGKVEIVGAVYDLASGEVRFLGTHPEESRLQATQER